MPTCWIIAGPNGVGKTTFALEYLPRVAGCRNFINADLIAAGLSPLEPGRELVTASRLLLSEIEQRLVRKEDFAFETTLAGRGYLRLIRRLHKEGWQIELIYLALPDIEMSRLRVAERVNHGGHDVPDRALVRRFPRSLQNLFEDYAKTTDRTRCFMNSGENPELVFEQKGRNRVVFDQALYEQLILEAGL
jgi:predicted ABC-type ATPase